MTEEKKQHKSSSKTTIKHLLIAVVILAVGFVLFFVLKNLKKPPQEAEMEVLAPLVDVARIDPCNIQMIISGYGTVNPHVEVDIVPQVTGNVVEIHPQFKQGGYIPSGQTIIKIDPRDYDLAVRQANAAVAQAKVQLEIEQAEAKVAKEEWYQLNPGVEPTSPLVLREPQIKQAQTNYESAQAQLATAQLNLERTTVTMPIDILVSEENIDLGQLARAGNFIGSAYGVKKAEVQVPLEPDDIKWFKIPSAFNGKGNQKGAKARIYTDDALSQYIWEGYVTRTVGQVDRRSRLIDVIIEVNDPFHSRTNPPLLPGTFVEVDILGETMEKVYKIPRMAFRNPNKIWVAKDGRLYIRQIDVIRSDQDFIYTYDALEPGEMIVTSPLDAVVDEMNIRYQGYNQPDQTDVNDVGNLGIVDTNDVNQTDSQEVPQ